MEKGRMIWMDAPKKTSIVEFDVPKAGPGAVVLKIIRASFCGSDLNTWSGNHPTWKVLKSRPLGHEGLGEVLELGEGRTHDNAGNLIKVGDRVAFVYYATCMSCSSCAKGRFDACKTSLLQLADTRKYPQGTYSTHVYLQPSQMFYKVPDEVPDYVASSVNCALSQVYYGIDLANLCAGEWILIQGAGGLGLHATAVAKFKNAKIIVVDGVKQRLDIAKRFGADHVIDMNEYPDENDRIKLIKEITGGDGPDVAIELTGQPAAFVEGIRTLAMAGRYVEIGTVEPSKKIEFHPAEMTRKCITIYNACRYDPRYLWKSLQFLKDNYKKFPYEEFSDKEYSLEEFDEMLEKVLKREVTRAAIVPR